MRHALLPLPAIALASLFAMAAASIVLGEPPAPTAAEILAKLHKEHPRLLANADDFAAL